MTSVTAIRMTAIRMTAIRMTAIRVTAIRVTATCVPATGMAATCALATRITTRMRRAQMFVLSCLIAWFAGAPLHAQTTTKTAPLVAHQFQRDSWRIADGLPRQEVTSIKQSPDGYLWVGAGQRVYRFDGVRFTPGLGPDLLNVKGSRTSVRTPQLTHVVAAGQMWITYEGGKLARYYNGKFETMMPYDTALLYGPMVPAAIPGGGMYMIFRDQVFKWVNYKYSPLLVNGAPVKRASNLTTDSLGVLYIGFRDGRVLRVESGRSVWLNMPTGPATPVFKLIAANNGALWIQYFERIVRWENGVAREIPFETSAATFSLMDVDGADGVWTATSTQGLWHLDASGLTAARITADELDGANVNTFSVDAEGSLWVGTSLGLERFRKVPFTTYAIDGGITEHNLIGAVWADSQTFWTLGRQGFLQRTHLLTAQAAATIGAPRFASAETMTGRDYRTTITSLTPSRDGSLWISGAGTIDYWSPQSGQLTSFARKDSLAPVMQVLEAKNGDVWAMSSSGPLKRVGNRFQKYIARNNERVPLPPYFGFGMMYEDRDEHVWIGSGLLLEIEKDSIVMYTKKNGLAGQPVQAVHQDREGTIWAVGGLGAITRVRNHKAVAVSLGADNAESFVTGIAEDTLGNLWLSGDIGVMRVPIVDLNAVADGRAKTITSITFTVADGLPNPSTAGTRSAYASPDGMLWFTFARGVAMVDPNKLYRNTLAPAVRIEDVIVDDHLFSTDSVQRGLPAQTYRVEFHFTGTSLLVPSRMRFRYTLEGAEKTWTEVGGLVRSATYTRLAPGPYTFRVQAANNDGVWNTTGTSLRFRVLPSWYQTWWARTGGVLFIVAIGATAALTVARVRLGQDEARIHAMMEERTRIAREVHDTLLQGFTGITLQLQGLKGKIRKAPETTEASMETLLETADATLLAARQAVWEMRPPDLERATLAEALGVALRRATGENPALRYRVTGTPRRLPPETEAALLRIGVEAASNAVKHAHAHELDVELLFSRNDVQLCVRDDGCGFEVERTLMLTGTHFGLIGIRERAKKVGADIKIVSVPGQGTTVTMLAEERSSRWFAKRA